MKAKSIISVLLVAFVVVSIFAALSRTSNSESPAPAPAVNQTTSDQSTGQPDEDAPKRQVTAIYFLTDVRCPSCVKIETWSHQAIFDGFEDELKSGLLKWEMINYEEEENRHYIEEYGLITKSVVLVDHFEGEEINFRNLPEVWNLLGDQEKFVTYIQDEVRLFINPNHNKGSVGEPT